MTMTDYPDTSQIVSVWSAHGHTFIGEDGNYERCLECGALYQLLPADDDPTRGRYCTASGDDPNDCTHDTSMVHGYAGEREDGPNHDCNCLLCH